MIIIRTSPGFANSIMEYCAGYALSRESDDEEIIIDIGLCQQSAWGYLIDYLNIPDYKKITYNTLDFDNTGFTNPQSIPAELKKDAAIIDISQYPGIKSSSDLRTINRGKYLCDWFMDQLKYYDKYMDELRPMISYKGKSENIEAFKNLIMGRTSIGVHFRRGDMLFADFATPTEDDYYKAAIEYCRAKIDKNALFCVFSDDIKYAEDLLGSDDNIRYIHFVGYDDADVEEFICLSLCDHRIRPKTSSYSDLADRINGSTTRKTILQGNLEKESVREKLKEWKYWTKRRILTSIVKKRFDEYREDIRRHDFNRKNSCVLNRREIDKYAPLFHKTDGSDKLDRFSKILDIGVLSENAGSLLDSMRKFELDYKTPDIEDEIDYRYKKFKGLYYVQEYEKAVGLADYIWGWMIRDNDFRKDYSDILGKLGVKRESELIGDYKDNIQIIIVSETPSDYSSQLYGFGELAAGLAKMGYNVTIVEKPKDETEKHYIKSNKYMTNRHEVNLGCRQFLYETVKENGFGSFASEIDLAADNNTDTIVIARQPDVFLNKADHVCYVWMDDKDENDPERAYQDRYSDKAAFMAEQADYILTCHKEAYPETLTDKVIPYENKTFQEPYWSTGERWKQHNCHRLSERTMNMCFALKKRLESR